MAKNGKVKEITTKAKGKSEADESEEESGPELRSKYARAAVQARWAAEKATDEELRIHVRSLDRHAMMTFLDKLRNACEIVAKEVNQRLCEETPETKCETCGGPRKGAQWRMLTTRREGPMVIRNVYFCSDVCIVIWNQKQTGVAGISDRGMSRGSAMPDEVPAKRIVDNNVAAARRMGEENNRAAQTMPEPGSVVAKVKAKSNQAHA